MSMGKQIYYHNIRENIKRMHPRLKELAIQAGAVPDNGTIITSSMDDSKFAESIVQECADIIKKDMELAHIQMIPIDLKIYANGRLQRTIKEHFGVE